MKLIFTILSSFWLASSALFLFMAVAFSSTSEAAYSSFYTKVVQVMLFLFPGICALSAVIVWWAHIKGWGPKIYWLNVFPVILGCVIFAFVFILLPSSGAGSRVEPMSVVNLKEPTFQIPNEVEIIGIFEFKKISDKVHVKEGWIGDQELIRKILDGLKSLPEEGGIMMSPTDEAGVIKVLFNMKDKSQYQIELYDGQIKAPDGGGFFTNDQDIANQKEVVDLILKELQ